MNDRYILIAPAASILAKTLYLPRQPNESDVLVADTEMYGKTFVCPTESASWQTVYVVSETELERKFNLLAKQWKRETLNLSSIQEIILHPSYQRIIGMGPDVIPIILRQLKRTPDFWFWALKCLSDVDPVTREIRGDISAMTEAWLDWGREHEYL